MQLGRLEPRPIRHHAAALERAAGEQGHGRGAVVGAVGAVDAGGAAELGHHGDDGLAPGVLHLRLDRRDGAVERTQQHGEAAVGSAFGGVGVPAVEGERADARTIGARQEPRRGARRFGEIGAHLSGAGRPRLLPVHAAGARDGRKSHAFLEHARERRIGVLVEIEQSRQRVIAGRRQAPRRP